jgi:hypothetical protein
MAEQPEYDMMIHLVGEQPVPILIAMRQFPEVRNHLLFATKDTERCARNIVCVEKDKGHEILTLSSAYDIAGIQARIEQVLKESGAQRPLFDLTGGTKMMFAAGFNALRELNAPGIYVDASLRQKAMRWIADPSGARQPTIAESLKPCLRLDDFFTAVGHGIQDPGHWSSVPQRATRVELAAEFWRRRDMIRFLQKDFADWVDKETNPRLSAGALPSFGNSITRTQGTLTLNGKKGDFADDLEIARFMSGGWFEEYVYSLLKPLEEKGEIFDLRIGLCPAWDQKKKLSPKEKGKQEFDLVFTDQYALYVVECKAARMITQGHIQKLENNTQHFGGTMGRGILVSAFHLKDAPYSRIQDSKLSAFGSECVSSEIHNRILSIRPQCVNSQPAEWEKNTKSKNRSYSTYRNYNARDKAKENTSSQRGSKYSGKPLETSLSSVMPDSLKRKEQAP